MVGIGSLIDNTHISVVDLNDLSKKEYTYKLDKNVSVCSNYLLIFGEIKENMLVIEKADDLPISNTIRFLEGNFISALEVYNKYHLVINNQRFSNKDKSIVEKTKDTAIKYTINSDKIERNDKFTYLVVDKENMDVSYDPDLTYVTINNVDDIKELNISNI